MLNAPHFNEGGDLPEHIDPFEQKFQSLKSKIHLELIGSLDLSRIGQLNDERMRGEIRQLAEKSLKERQTNLSQLEYERLLDELIDEAFALGPLERLMHDPEVTDILVNDPYHVYVERRGRLELTDVIFADNEHLMRIIQRIVGAVGRRIDEVSPLVDARLADGSRVNAVVPPLALDGPSISIRRFGVEPLKIEDITRNGSIVDEMTTFLQAAMEGRIGCLISGGTGAGKTTLLNACSRFIPVEERLVTIEDSAELILQHPHRVRMETRPPNSEGQGGYTQRELVRNSLRMRPDRIIVGEVRGAEVWDMLQAMNTGHEGSLTTIHANSAQDALARLEMMVAMTGFDIPLEVVRKYIATGMGLIVHAARLKGGVRRVMQITEIVGVENGEYVIADLFKFRQTGLEDGVATGEFWATGVKPTFLDRLEASGVELDESIFTERRLTESDSAS